MCDDVTVNMYVWVVQANQTTSITSSKIDGDRDRLYGSPSASRVLSSRLVGVGEQVTIQVTGPDGGSGVAAPVSVQSFVADVLPHSSQSSIAHTFPCRPDDIDISAINRRPNYRIFPHTVDLDL